MPYSTPPKNATLKIEPFQLQVPDEEIEHFKQLLKLSRLAPQTFENNQTDTGKFGVTHKWMTEAKDRWQNQYDWRQREAYFNSFPNFKTSIKDDKTGFTFDIHFAALFSEKTDAVPIVFLHGWPGSFLEFLGVLETFKSKYKSSDLPYHIIVPSLPGYTLSSGPPTDQDFKTDDLARIIDKLMQGLGFGDSGYVAQGGDIGAYTCRCLSHYSSCKAIHLNFSLMERPKNLNQDLTVEEVEQRGLKRARDFGLTGSAYALEHGTRPSTIGFTLDSSPIALLAWIGEKFITWTDTTPSLEQILDSITLYWFTHSFPRCIYPYREFHGSSAGAVYIHSDPKYHIKQPLGYSWFPQELAPMPVSWVKTTGNLVWSKRHNAGGHFAAMEKPEVLVEDVESFVKQVWKASGSIASSL
ncbi:hypothetical protein LTS08_003525 [Lithohypha guttulata]|nr:hypothetical protein LTS08_003525 [Lithohypha guttulata]